MISRSLWVISTTVTPRSFRVAQDAEQLVGLLRRQHRARLVEDQDARAAEQHLQDLDPLLLADRQVGDQRVGIDRAGRIRAPSRASSARAAARPPASSGPPSAPSTRFSSTVKVSTSMKCWCTMPMPWRDGVARAVASRTGLPSTRISPASAAIEAVEDAHQGRLAGAVLADDAGDRALLDRQRHAAHGVHAAERLVDPAQLDRRARHGVRACSVLLLM